MVQQVRRAGLSVYLNIAEGCSRKSATERKRFYEISRSSVVEVDAALDVASDLQYIKQENLKDTGEILVSCFKT